MFDLVRNNRKFIQLVLALLILPFALWGVDSYVRNSGSDEVASVGEMPIRTAEFQQALQEQQERVRSQMPADAARELLDSPAFRRGVLQELINQRLLLLHARQSQLGISDAALAGFITAVPSLQENGKFSRERYQALVAAQGMSVDAFEARVRQDLLMQQPLMAVGNASVAGRLPAGRWLAAELEEREIAEMVLRADQFTQVAKPDAEAVKRFHAENRARFELPERLRVEYLVLSQAKLIQNVKIAEEQIKAWYQANEARYRTEEQRQASHILIRLDQGAAAEETKAAQAKAEQLLAQLQASPGDFAKLAKQHSQDPGSAEKGGDLGFFGRGMMVKPFEDAVFGLRENQLSGVVRSDFGLHIIKLTGIRPQRARPYEAVRGEIEAELKRQTGNKLYAETAESFANTVYEQPDSLKPAAEKYALAIERSDWLVRGKPAMPPFNHPRLQQLLFADDAVKNKRNTEAVDIGNNTLVSARVVEHQPAQVEPLEKVAAAIEQALMREAAVKLAEAEGQRRLERLLKGEKLDQPWGATRGVSRIQAAGLPAEARKAIFGVATRSLPAYVGTPVPGGYALYRIDKVKPYDQAATGDAATRGAVLRQQYAQVVAQEELVGWLAALKQRYPVVVNEAALERK